MNTGHRRLANGSLVRVDIELGRWVGSLYTPQMTVKTVIVGNQAEVSAWADRICRLAAAPTYPARITAAGGATSA
jgi:hypothetical protein